MKALFCCLIITIVLCGCDATVNENNSYDYSIEQQMNCFCPQSSVWVKLFVKADTVADAIRISDNIHLSYGDRKPYKSIKGLLDEVARLNTGTYNVIITMDSVNNYPSYLYFNPNPVANGDTVQAILDAQWSYTTKNYIKLN
jgi:hypothetical protein